MLRREVVGLVLVAVSSVTMMALLSITRGALSTAWVVLLRRTWGWGMIPVTVGMLLLGVGMLGHDSEARLSPSSRNVVGLELLLLALLGQAHLVFGPRDALRAAERGAGGGYVGWMVSFWITSLIGRGWAFLVLLLLALAGLALLTDLSWAGACHYAAYLGSWIDSWRKARQAPESTAVQQARRTVKPPSSPQKPPRKTIRQRTPLPAPPEPSPVRRRSRRLPPLNLLNGGTNEPRGGADIRYRTQVIEETLASLGVPASVVEVNQGPSVTQFGVEPGFREYSTRDGKLRQRKVTVNKILALQNDLALALAAAPIRIEAPVPGRSVVGIEVPNSQTAMVSLRGVVESDSFRKIRSRLRLALGRDVAGRAVAADLAQMPHLLIAGATGSGKSVCINAITACLLLNNTPDELRLLMIDPKMVELTPFNGIPHLVAPVITEVDEVVRALRWVTAQMDTRYKLFSQNRARNIEMYNELATSRGEEALPYMVILIDELADLMMVAPDEIERSICRIAQLARATGIHLVVATQRPSVDVVTGLIKANFPARISFTVSSQIDSRVILDTSGAEKLLGRGDMLYMSSDSSKLVRLQGCFVSDEELDRLHRFWSERIDWFRSDSEAESVPWQEMAADGETDDLLDRAIELAMSKERITTSFLQRRLRIGYPRAARLMDMLMERQIVGPPEDGGRARRVLGGQDDDDELDDDDLL